MSLKIILLALLLYGWTNLAIALLLFNLTITLLGKRLFASFCYKFAEDYNRVSHSMKVELFEELNDMKKGDKISILEVGAGPGTNFGFYNRPATVQCVEPNLNFRSYFDKNKAKWDSELEIGEIKEGFGEDLAGAGFKDESVDAVVMTLVLCSVADPKKCIKEIKRVLKPGGKFFYMEHIAADSKSQYGLRLLQNILMLGGFWPFMADGCCTNRATDVTMSNAGFTDVNQKNYDLPIENEERWNLKLLGRIVKPHVMGIATK